MQHFFVFQNMENGCALYPDRISADSGYADNMGFSERYMKSGWLENNMKASEKGFAVRFFWEYQMLTENFFFFKLREHLIIYISLNERHLLGGLKNSIHLVGGSGVSCEETVFFA